jgi:hypothetical protein
MNEVRPEIPEWIPESISILIELCWSTLLTTDPELRPTFDEIYAALENANFRFFGDVPSEVISEYTLETKSKEGLD